MKTTLATVGRILYALPFLGFGIGHLTNAHFMAGMVPLPGGIFWIYLTGLALLAASISIIIQTKARLATLLLGIMLIIFVLLIHLPNAMSANQATQMMGQANLMKDLSLAGAAFYLSGTLKS